MGNTDTKRVVFVNNGIATEVVIPNTLGAMQALVGGLIERVMDFARGGQQIDIYANEEAFLLNPEGESQPEPITGVLILGPYFYVGSRGPDLISLTDAQVAFVLGTHATEA